ncbi:MAG: phytoene synthase, partial [Pseudomonadota bacterium]|nr:phytoene synthase [Pseudomonadota bacterium]
TIARRRWDIYREPFADRAEFDSYIQATTTLPMQVAATLLGAGAAAPINDIGYASGVANWLVATAELAARGRIPLLDGRPEAVQALATNALERLSRARSRRADLPPKARPAVLAAWQAGPLLRLAQAHPDRVADGSLHLPPLRNRARLAWLAATGRW